MKILITGSRGFIGQNLIKLLRVRPVIDEIMEYNRNNSFEDLNEFCAKADYVFHLAAVLRPNYSAKFNDNINLTQNLERVFTMLQNEINDLSEPSCRK